MVRAVAEVAVWWAAGVLLWMITVSVMDIAEIVLAVVVPLICALFARRIRKVLVFDLPRCARGGDGCACFLRRW